MLGHLGQRERAGRIDDHAASLSTSTPGSGVTDEPVAMTMFFARDGLAADLDAVGAVERGMALEPVDLVLLEQEFDAAGQPLDRLRLLGRASWSRSSSRR